MREQTRAFVEKHVAPTRDTDDAEGIFRREIFDALAPLGFHSWSQPREWGGRQGSYRAYYAFLEELGRGSLALSVAVGVTNLVQGALLAFGNTPQKEKYLKPLIAGKFLGAFSLSEPHSGSDASALRLSAVKEGDAYRINGTKCWCSNAGHADLYLVMARTAEHKSRGISAFLVPKDTPGFRVGKQEKKLGLRASTLAELVFDDCRIPEAQRLGAEGQGFEIALSQLDAGRIAIAAAGLSAAGQAIEIAWERLCHGLDPNDGIRPIFAEYFARWQSLKGLMATVADARTEGLAISDLAASLKLTSSELAMQVCHDAVHYLGYEGVRLGSGVERLLRDSKALQIVEGTNQIQRLVLGRQLDGMVS